MYALTIGQLRTPFEQRAVRMQSPENVFKFLDWNTKQLLRKSLPDDFREQKSINFHENRRKSYFIVRKHRFNVPERFGSGLG